MNHARAARAPYTIQATSAIETKAAYSDAEENVPNARVTAPTCRASYPESRIQAASQAGKPANVWRSP